MVYVSRFSLGLKLSVTGNHQSDIEAVQSTPITMVLAYMSQDTSSLQGG